MKIKRPTALILLLMIITAMAACSKKPVSNNETASPTNSAPGYSEYVPEAQTEEQATMLPLEFDKNAAVELGDFESDVYGKLKVFFQEDRLFLFDEEGAKRFELYAYSYIPNYEGTPVELNGDDVDFDGHTDFYLLYSQGNLNSYYCFWIWNMEKRTFEYYLPLSSVPSPELDPEQKRIIASDRISLDTVVTTEYIWNNGKIVPVANSERHPNPLEVSDEETTEGTDSSVAVIDGMLLSSVIMREDPDKDGKWMCRIEDESIVKLSSSTLDRLSGSRTFIFRAVSPGTTTVVLRNAEVWEDESAPQRILNITVNRNYTLKIVVVE